MYLLDKFLEVSQSLQWIAGAVFMALGAGLVLTGFLRRSRRCVVIGLLIGTIPITLPALVNLSQSSGQSARRAEVLAMVRQPLPSNYPRQIVVEGDMAADEVERLMMMTDVDQVVVADSGDSAWYQHPDRSEACRAARRAINGVSQRYDTNVGDGLDDVRRQYARCRPTTGSRFALVPTRLLVRIDGRVTRRAQDRKPAPNAVQINLMDAPAST